MLEKLLKKYGWTDIIIALVFILLGIMLIVRPEVITAMISIILGVICIIIGILKLFDYLSKGKVDKYLIAISIVAIITGIIIMFCGDMIFSVFRILVAIWIIYSGIMNLQTSIIWKDYKSKLWITTLILSIVTIIVGIYMLVNKGAVFRLINFKSGGIMKEEYKKINKKKLINSFKYAIQGIKSAFKTEQNLKIHFIVTVIVIFLGILLKIGYTEWAICFLLFGFVITAELLNTAIEVTVDLAMPQKNDKAKLAKDIAAGAVLVSSIIAVLVGIVIFLPKIVNLFL